MIRVVLIDDHAMIRRGLRETLSEASDITVVGEAGDYAGWRDLSRQIACDVLILDVNLPGRNGIEILQLLADDAQSPAVVILSQFPEDQYGIRALKAGAMAYLNKSGDPGEIICAVRTVAAGRKHVTPGIAAALMESVIEKRPEQLHQALSERELQTMLLIARGAKLAEIAGALSISPKTVSVYRARVLDKLKLGGNADIAAYAVRHRLID